MTYTEKDFLEWLRINRLYFKNGGHTADEVTELAIMVGFERKMIYPILSHYQDYLDDTSIDRRSDVNTLIFEMTVKDVAQMKENLAKPKPFDMGYLWARAEAYLITGEEEAA